MNIKQFLLVSLFCGSFHFACSQKADAFKWLVGTWRLQTANGQIVETWKVVNDSSLAGKSVFVKASKDTTLQETIELVYRSGQWIYRPTAIGQNNNQPVSFSVIYLRGTEFICENPNHDFPQRIVYRRIKNLLYASVEGRKNGRYSKQNFDYIGD